MNTSYRAFVRHENFLVKIFRTTSWFLVDNFFSKFNLNPNHITYFRLFLTFVSFPLMISFNWVLVLVGYSLFLIAELLDFIDGDYARTFNKTSVLGSFLEKYFDNVVYPVSGLLGLFFGFSLSLIHNNLMFLCLFFLTAFFNNLFCKTNTLGKERVLEPNKHDSCVYTPVFGVGFVQGVVNVLKISLMWENQIVLLGVLISSFFSNGLFALLGFLIVCLLNITAFIKMSIDSFKKYKKN